MEQHGLNKEAVILSDEVLFSRIYIFRGQKVMLDSDLAELYGVETKAFKQAVRRNIERFPKDFMFELDKQEFRYLRSQIVTSNNGVGGNRYAPMVFTEQGVAMLSSILKSKLAIQINIQIMRIFIKIRQFLSDNSSVLELAEVKLTLEKLTKRQDGQDKNIELIFQYIDRLEDKLEKPNLAEREKIGYKVGQEK